MSDEPTYSSVTAILGNSRRDSVWHLTDEVDVFTGCGRALFDLRQVETSDTDVIEISVTCILGRVTFIVPHGTMVVLDGTSFLAASKSEVSAEGSSPLPRIEVTATTVFGSVRVVSDDHPVGSEHTGDLDEADGPTTSEPTATSSDDDRSDGSVNDEAAQHHETTPEASWDDDGSST